MVERIFRFLIAIVLAAILFWIVVWVAGAVGFVFPPHVFQLLVVLFVLIILLYAWRLFGGMGNPFKPLPPP